MNATADSPTPRLSAGQGLETRGARFDVDDFIIVDASVAVGARAPLHDHERAYFALILRGGLEEAYGSRAVTLAAGVMNFLPVGTPHQVTSHGARAIRIELPETVMVLAGSAGPVLQQPTVFAQSPAVSLARRVATEIWSRDHGWPLVVHGLILELLGHVVRDQTFTRDRGTSKWLRQVRDRLHSEWDRRVSLGELARFAGVHPIHLARAFRASYGCSIGEYRRRLQLRAAEERLLRSSDDLREVAVSCGFADQSHFSKAFRRAFGVSPGRYRRTLR